MTKRNKKAVAPPAGSDAAKAADLEGGAALDVNKIGDAEDNKDKVDEANARPTDPDELELDEPATVAEMSGGAGALPESLAPAAANARKAQTASDLQAEIAKRPDNPIAVKREHLREIAKFVGKPDTARVLGRLFGVSEPDQVGVMYLDVAIDELHKAADAPKEGK